METRLSQSDWIDHGLRTLAAGGSQSLRVAPMAAALNVSRGSFYWHFRDIADFRMHVLRHWEEQTTERVAHSLEVRYAGADRLRHLFRRAFAREAEAGSQVAEDRIRAWALENADVAAAVAAIDVRRIAHIAGMLMQAGVPRVRSRSRATFLYWAYLGYASSAPGHSAKLDDSDLDDIVALVERQTAANGD